MSGSKTDPPKSAEEHEKFELKGFAREGDSEQASKQRGKSEQLCKISRDEKNPPNIFQYHEEFSPEWNVRATHSVPHFPPVIYATDGVFSKLNSR